MKNAKKTENQQIQQWYINKIKKLDMEYRQLLSLSHTNTKELSQTYEEILQKLETLNQQYDAIKMKITESLCGYYKGYRKKHGSDQTKETTLNVLTIASGCIGGTSALIETADVLLGDCSTAPLFYSIASILPISLCIEYLYYNRPFSHLKLKSLKKQISKQTVIQKNFENYINNKSINGKTSKDISKEIIEYQKRIVALQKAEQEQRNLTK